jgi:hypothetical protein
MAQIACDHKTSEFFNQLTKNAIIAGARKKNERLNFVSEKIPPDYRPSHPALYASWPLFYYHILILQGQPCARSNYSPGLGVIGWR